MKHVDTVDRLESHVHEPNHNVWYQVEIDAIRHILVIRPMHRIREGLFGFGNKLLASNDRKEILRMRFDSKHDVHENMKQAVF